jgi:hypothetical protein
VHHGRLCALRKVAAHDANDAVRARSPCAIYVVHVPAVQRIVFANNAETCHKTLLSNTFFGQYIMQSRICQAKAWKNVKKMR